MYACNYSIRTLKKTSIELLELEHFVSDFRTCDLYFFGPLAVCLVLSFLSTLEAWPKLGTPN